MGAIVKRIERQVNRCFVQVVTKSFATKATHFDETNA
jgi:hypothetical protein